MLQALASLSAQAKAAQYATATAAAICRHPAVPIKLVGGRGASSPLLRALHSRRFQTQNAAAASLKRERQASNVSRLYARRTLELAAASAALLQSRSALMEAAAHAKPVEWGTVDLEKKRREFGEKISALGNTKLERVYAAGSRIVSLAILASPLLLLAPAAAIAGPDSKADKAAWDYAIWGIEKAGPTFIKLVQWATTRSDLFSAEFISNFSKLQDETRGHSWNDTEKMLRKAFGDDYLDFLSFDEFQDDDLTERTGQKSGKDREPIGSGCIAQVYRAKLKQPTTLHPAGTEVAVKVQHPHILHKVCVDFYIMNKIAALLEKIPYLSLDYLSVKDSVNQFRDIMLPQLDLRVEARNLTRFRRDFADDEQVAFPEPVHDLTSSEVLVETFVKGEHILNFLRPERSVKDRQELATVGLRTAMKMIFLYDFVHADLHPGNMLVDRNKDARGSPLRVNMIDCGLVVEMGESDHVNLVKILGAFIKRDGYLAGQLMVDTAKKCQGTPLDVQLFCQGIQKICDDDEQNHFLEKIGDYLADICFLACKHKVKLESAFINAALACEIMEGIATSLYPTMQVQHIALPMVFRAEVMHGLKGFHLPKFG